MSNLYTVRLTLKELESSSCVFLNSLPTDRCTLYCVELWKVKHFGSVGRYFVFWDSMMGWSHGWNPTILIANSQYVPLLQLVKKLESIGVIMWNNKLDPSSFLGAKIKKLDLNGTLCHTGLPFSWPQIFADFPPQHICCFPCLYFLIIPV